MLRILRELQMSMRPARASNGGDGVCYKGMLTVTLCTNLHSQGT